MGGLFAEYQPRYAEHGVATFPVNDNKRPAVSQYLRMGLAASRKLVEKFTETDGLGFACGSRSKITVLDIDSPDERLLADALAKFGNSPLVVRSGSGHFQAWYRHNGEAREIRPDKSLPIDILGGGYVVAPPSRSIKGDYCIIEGSLDDLPHLPTLTLPEAPATPADPLPDGRKVHRGRRNDTLWRECMKAVRDCPSVDQLLAFATKANQSRFYEPLPDAEVLGIVASAWTKETRGDNLFGRGGGVVIRVDQIDDLLDSYPDAFILLTILRRHHWGRQFVCANAMGAIMPGGGWPVKRLAAARRKLEEIGEIKLVRPASRQTGPSIYTFKGCQI